MEVEMTTRHPPRWRRRSSYVEEESLYNIGEQRRADRPTDEPTDGYGTPSVASVDTARIRSSSVMIVLVNR